MRAGLSTIQQTLTAEAATVLNNSIAEAARRNHGQTTPLHVAATLLSSPSSYLRQACIKSHPNSSHPLQCRALELCFSVALERLPTAQNPGSEVLDPPISNALMVALKRAQAHQRRGCPQQQQQPLLAVKVELEQLIISILDDPSVSRVMREASFSSPTVKASIERSLNSNSTNTTTSPVRLEFKSAVPVGSINRNLYLNPRLQQGAAGQQRIEGVKRVFDVLLRSKKRNPVLVGEAEPELVVKEILRRIENKEVDGVLRSVEVVGLEKDFAFDKNEMVAKIKELGSQVGAKIGNLDCGGVIIDLGDLKWLVENNQQQQGVSEAGRAAVAEMGKLLRRFGEGSGRVWLIGTATCETYLRCQVYHSSMESDWDLQAVPFAARSPLPATFPRPGSNGILGCSTELLSPLKRFATAAAQPRQLYENLDPARKPSCCPHCMQNYEQELAKLLSAKEFDKPSSCINSESARSALPQWLQNAKAHDDDDVKTMDQTQTKDKEIIREQKTQELQKKWNDTCLHLHPNFHQLCIGSERFPPTALSMTSLYNSSLLGSQSFQPKLQLNRNIGETLQLNPNLVASRPMERTCSQPRSPVRTDLVLGEPKKTSPERTHKEGVRDFFSCIRSEKPQKFYDWQSNNKLLNTLDIDSFKELLKGLKEEVWWQQDAASAVATTVTQCKIGNGKRRVAGSKGDNWLLFAGPDRVGKKKMAFALSDKVCGSHPVVICLGSRRDDGESDVSFRGKTVLDRIAEAVRRNPFSVLLLEDIDEADMLVRGSIKRAMERGRLADSHGREISLGNVTFILTANWLPDNLKSLSNGITLDEKKLTNLASGGWQLRLSLSEKTAKRRASWLHEEDRSRKPRQETCSSLSFNLNEAADMEDNKGDGSHNSSGVTVDHEEENGLVNRLLSNSTSSVSPELLNSVDDAIFFKPVDFSPIIRDIENSITKKFSSIIGEKLSIEIPVEALEKITSGVWIGQTGLEEWTEKALVPSFQELKTRLPLTGESLSVRLELDDESCNRSHGDWLPSSVKVVID